LKTSGGSLLPFNWAKLLYGLWKKRWSGYRVPLMGVAQKHQNSRLASQLAFMMIETIRERGVNNYGADRAEVGWILEDNQGMNAIADAINGEINRTYSIYEKAL
ncbi:MAG: N-acetyltransferase, partial [Parasphingopyxis sp.]